MGGDIRDFKDMLAGYKATIAIALGSLNMLVTPCPYDRFEYLFFAKDDHIWLFSFPFLYSSNIT
jgi:hypothetical protein